jgi:hypothetical protein
MIVTPQTCHLSIKSEVVSIRIQAPAPQYIPHIFQSAVYEGVCDFKVRGPPGLVGLSFGQSAFSECALWAR